MKSRKIHESSHVRWHCVIREETNAADRLGDVELMTRLAAFRQEVGREFLWSSQ